MPHITSNRIFYTPVSDDELDTLTSRLRAELDEHFSFAPKSTKRLEEVVLGTLGMTNGRQQWQSLREAQGNAADGKASGSAWNDDALQFTRLVAEFSMAADNDNVSLTDVADSMDLEMPEIFELFARAEAIFERSKPALPTNTQENGDPEGSKENPLGLDEAINQLDDDDDLSLWECEIGLFNLENDPRTPMETFFVVVAAETADEANTLAQEFAEENVPVVRDMAFSGMSLAHKVDPSDYLLP